MSPERPSFKKPKSRSAYESPEELFSKLPNRSKTHGYLRGPQADALREYLKRAADRDIALELPTGTGKTLVGLLIAEWCRRRSSQKVAYLTLTNQLAKQVLEEAARLGIPCADLRGTKETRDPAAVGKYQTGTAIGITTYYNLFNTNPIVQASDLLVLDDAHGGEQAASKMWTVQVDARDQHTLYQEVFTVLRPAMTEAQHRILTDETRDGQVELICIQHYPEVANRLTDLFDGVAVPSVKYSWSLIRNHLPACLVFGTRRSITIRPVVPPTDTHDAFANTRQRIYMSATLGGEGDLRRCYGITKVTTVRAQHPQWGKRYIFAPGLGLDENSVGRLCATLWRSMKVRRALLLAPSFVAVDRFYKTPGNQLEPTPTYLTAKDIEDSLDEFTQGTDRILCLAGRYDGLDLPGEDCRLLFMSESPGAIGPLERHQREHWKLGPLLRRRERTRLVQGLGRCTRDATDFAVIILLGQSLVNSVTAPTVVGGLPSEIQREIKWGLVQSQQAGKNLDAFSEMILGLLDDPKYRREANESLEETDLPPLAADPAAFESGARFEVKYARAMWQGSYSKAIEVARDGVDEAAEDALAGYRAWWFFLGSLAAHAATKPEVEVDCLRRAKAIGINAGFSDALLRKIEPSAGIASTADVTDIQVEAIWAHLDKIGWHGLKFDEMLVGMHKGLRTLEATPFHSGMERLGEFLGAETMRPTGSGTPDVVWIFADRCFTFEVKTGKQAESTLSKKEVQQAAGHPNWLRATRSDVNERIDAVVVSSSSELASDAIPHASDLTHITPDQVRSLASTLDSALRELRAEFSGREFAAARLEFKGRLKQRELLLPSIYRRLSEKLLKAKR
ncbi:MAG TPA: DEAD/DEAH box helicase [Candidatus Polarisedimenticolia bacterium]|nr:DEAD/DEAH box helicase [Candidatus Polarisedimenticolia bacterium]